MRIDSTRPSRPITALMVIAVAPLVIVFIGSLWTVVGWAAGASPFWPDPGLTMSEAAALANAGEVVRLIEVEHQDPNRSWPVREGILGDARSVTPLEAAVWIRRAQMVQVLLREGAVAPSTTARAALICRAEASGASDVAELLVKTADGSDPRGNCPQSGQVRLKADTTTTD